MKLFIWLARWAVSVATIAGLSLFSAWFVVNLYVEEIMKHYQIQNVGTKIQFSDVLARLGEDWNIVKPRSGTASGAAQPQGPGRSAPVMAQPAAGSGVGGAAAGNTEAGNGGGASSSPGGGTQQDGKPSQTGEHVPEDAVAVSGRLSQAGSSSAGAKGSMVMSTEDFAKKKAAMSSDDKMKLFSLLVNKLPPEQFQAISTMVEDGITSDDLKQLDTTLKKYLTPDEYKQILDIIQKY